MFKLLSFQELALSVLMKLIVKQSNYPMSTKQVDPFPHSLFKVFKSEIINLWLSGYSH